MSEEKLFWLGKGTLGDIKNGEEIPKDYISAERFRELEKEGLVGCKIVATIDNDSEKDLEIKDLKAQKETISKKLLNAENEISKLEALLQKVSAEKDKLIKRNAKVSAEKKVDEKPVKVGTETGKAGPI